MTGKQEVFEGGRIDWELPQKRWVPWRDAYLKGLDQECGVCGVSSSAVLRPIARVASFECGHIMKLPPVAEP